MEIENKESNPVVNLKTKNTFVEGFGGGFHGLYGERDEGESVTRDRIANLFHDLGDGDELVGVLGELVSTLNNGVGIDYRHGYAFGGLAALGQDLN